MVDLVIFDTPYLIEKMSEQKKKKKSFLLKMVFDIKFYAL
jgi:hypothetical protein